MRVQRFYAPDARAGELVELSRDETGHLRRVLRLRPGDAVRIFDGRGSEFDGIVERLGKLHASIRITGSRAPGAELAVAVTLAIAALKGEAMDDVVRDAAMIGVAAIQPLLSERCEVPLAALDRAARRERWERLAVAGAKQSGRAVVPAIHPPKPLAAVLAAIAAGELPNPGCMFVEPNAAATAACLDAVTPPPPQAATLVVGPEGGWTADELSAGASVCRLITLRGPTLRADAMPVVATTALLCRWGVL